MQAQAAQQVAVPSAGLSSTGMDELTQLAGLHDQGILSDEEFAAQKAKILG
jgi:Short C-terminal domain